VTEDSQQHLIDGAVHLLNYIKDNGGLSASVSKLCSQSEKDQKCPAHLDIGGAEYTYSNYESIIRNLTKAGMLRRRSGVYKISDQFCKNLDKASDCYREFLRSIKTEKEEIL